MNAGISVHPKIFDGSNESIVASGFHRDLFGGLLMGYGPKSFKNYKERDYNAEVLASEEIKPEN